MTDSLSFDSGAIRTSASTLVDAGGQVPTMTPLDLAGCGSSAVAAAAERFNGRSKKFVALLALQLSDVGGDAQRAADAWDAQEAALAATAAGGTP